MESSEAIMGSTRAPSAKDTSSMTSTSWGVAMATTMRLAPDLAATRGIAM